MGNLMIGIDRAHRVLLGTSEISAGTHNVTNKSWKKSNPSLPYLQELQLVVTVSREDTYQVVDGNNLYTDILIHLSQLKTFRFSIYTYIYNRNVSIDNFPSNDDIQQSFDYNKFGEIDSYVQHTIEKDEYGCHVYSLPFTFDMFNRLSMSFLGGVFYHVKILVANDYVPWEENFVKKIAESFPFIETLFIANSKPKKNKLQSSNETQKLEVTTFTRLSELRVTLTHTDYIEQLLFNRYTHLPRLCLLEIKYDQL
ncbi:hypothetical protein I4U23_010935 [Adineta vaga]|nr:hypothetical protein I4U23_010935 [Adineta vaga]